MSDQKNAIVKEHSEQPTNWFEAYYHNSLLADFRQNQGNTIYKKFYAEPSDGHFVLLGRCGESPQEVGAAKIQGVAHNKTEAEDKLYHLAMSHAMMLQWKYSSNGTCNVQIIDETSRAKEGKLAPKVQ